VFGVDYEFKYLEINIIFRDKEKDYNDYKRILTDEQDNNMD